MDVMKASEIYRNAGGEAAPQKTTDPPRPEMSSSSVNAAPISGAEAQG